MRTYKIEYKCLQTEVILVHIKTINRTKMKLLKQKILLVTILFYFNCKQVKYDIDSNSSINLKSNTKYSLPPDYI